MNLDYSYFETNKFSRFYPNNPVKIDNPWKHSSPLNYPTTDMYNDMYLWQSIKDSGLG